MPAPKTDVQPSTDAFVRCDGLSSEPPNKKRKAKNETCGFCQRTNTISQDCSPEERGFESFVLYHSCEQVFFPVDVTEALRYDPVVELLKRKEKGYIEAEDRVRQLKSDSISLRQRYAATRSPPARELDYIIHNAVDGINRRRTDAFLADETSARRERLSQQSTYGLPYTFKTLGIHGSLDEPVHLKIVTTLANSTFYCGHQPGDYVVRYCTPSNPYQQEQAGSDLKETPTWSAQGSIFRSLAILDEVTPLNAKSNFTYCGQVPRPMQEYLYRLKIVLPDVIGIFASVLSYHLSDNRIETHSKLEAVIGAKSAKQQHIGMLYQLWRSEFEREAFPGNLCAEIRRCSRVHEFAYLFGKVCQHGLTTMMDSCRPLVWMIQHATQWHLYEIIQIEDEKRAAEAENLLFDKKDFEHILVFEDEGVEDVHDFYSKPRYNCDKNHPRQQYRASFIAEQVKDTLQLVKVLATTPDEAQSLGSVFNNSSLAATYDNDDEPAIDADESEPDDENSEDCTLQ